MSRTKTIFIDLQKLHRSDGAVMIVRLMMACNDIFIANDCLSQFMAEQAPIRKHVQKGALMYFVRLQCGHLNEAMKIIQEIKGDVKLYDRVKHCSPLAQDSFGELVNCLKGGSQYDNFCKYIGLIRHNIIFHYDEGGGKLIGRALADRSNRPETNRSKLTKGDHISLHRFELADDILDSIICRQFWKIPKDVDLSQEANRCADFGSNLCKSLLNFGGEFIERYIQDHASC